MSTNEVRLDMLIAEPDADAERVDALTRRLMRDLRDLGAESVGRPAAESLPEGTKSPGAFTLGALALVAAPTFLPKLIEFMQAWTLRGENRVVKIKTPNGVEVEFTPEKRLSQDELLDLVGKLTARAEVSQMFSTSK